jgi:hypothetical protein
MSAPRRLRALSAVLFLAAAAAPTVARADGPPAQGTIVVTLEDGSTIPLHNWSLSYEYAMAKQGVSPLFAPTTRKNAPELYIGKKAIPTAGQTLTIAYLESMRSTETDTGVKTEKVKTVRDLTLAGPGGPKTTLKVEPPVRELLAPSIEKSVTLAARTLDLVGETITGTKRSFCLWSYTPVVECGGTSADRVVKIEFQP